MPSAQDDLMAAVRTHLEKRGIRYVSVPQMTFGDPAPDVLDGPRAKTKERAIERYLPLFRAYAKDAETLVLCIGTPTIVPVEGGMFCVASLLIKNMGDGQ